MLVHSGHSFLIMAHALLLFAHPWPICACLEMKKLTTMLSLRICRAAMCEAYVVSSLM